jgi:hypothetical protein
MCWEGAEVVNEGRKMLGATHPGDSDMGTIRGNMAIDIGRNICHGSDSVESAEKEIKMWFPAGTISWENHSDAWVNEEASTPAPAKGHTERRGRPALAAGALGNIIADAVMNSDDDSDYDDDDYESDGNSDESEELTKGWRLERHHVGVLLGGAATLVRCTVCS